jgi:DNA-directed RNA polymerase subunit alpha
MPQAMDLDVKDFLLSAGSFGPPEARQLVEAISADPSRIRPLREAVQQLEEKEDNSSVAKTRLGLCYFLLGRYTLASDALASADGPVAKYYLARSQFALEQFQKAIDNYIAAEKAGFDPGLCQLGRAEALRYKGDAAGALTVLDKLSGAIEQTAEYLFQRGATVAALGGNPQEVVALFERAVEVDGNHPGALFGLALESDRRGNDDTAVQLYERSLARPPAHLGTLLNLGVLYEDRNQYDRARQCYLRILDVYPNHPRARLFFKDAQASGEMFFDEDAQRKRDRLSQVLSVPVTDFELSVRSRNCLQKMGIMTLGDLAMTTEQELLASKNFGETSLVEIKDLLSSKGLELGQLAHERTRGDFGFEPAPISADEQALLSKPIADLNLSVRARKCMIRLSIATVGDLLRHTGDELLECKNFGVTSLNEVREKLTMHGLKLRGD